MRRPTTTPILVGAVIGGAAGAVIGPFLWVAWMMSRIFEAFEGGDPTAGTVSATPVILASVAVVAAMGAAVGFVVGRRRPAEPSTEEPPAPARPDVR